MSHTEKMREALEKIENLSGGDACEYRTIALDGLAKADAIAQPAQPASHVPEADFGNNQPARQEQADKLLRAKVAHAFDNIGHSIMAAQARLLQVQLQCKVENLQYQLDSQEQAQQPSGGEVVAHVAEVYMSRYTLEWTNGPLPVGTPLTLATPKPEPMTDEQVLTLAARHLGEMHVENCGLGDIKEFARAIEAHHAITKE